MDVAFLRRVSVSSDDRLELHAFATERQWLRLRDAAARRTLGFWSQRDFAIGWRAAARELAAKLLYEAPPAWSLALWPSGWDFWGPGIPAPIRAFALDLDDIAAPHALHSAADLDADP